jgi:hypothetical protein
MISYRRINNEDKEVVHNFVIEGMRADLYPLHLNDEKIDRTIQAMIDDYKHWNLAAFDDEGRMVGGLGALVVEMPWFDRCEAHIVMFRSTHQGVAATLMKQFFKWVEDNPLIRRVFHPLEFDASPAMVRLSRSYGFNGAHVVSSYYKG